MDDNIKTITIPVHTEIDAAVVLEVAISLKEAIEDLIESYGYEAHVNEEEISVDDDDKLFGGDQ